MSRLTAIVVLTVVAAFAGGCDKKDETAGAATTATVVSTAAVAGGVKAGTSDDPVEQDFEDEAEASITAANLEAEIAKMEAELK